MQACSMYRLRAVALIAATVLATVPMEAASSVTLTPARDTALFSENADYNLGASDLIVGTTGRFDQNARSLIYFDVASAVPAGSTITGVSFRDRITRQSQG